MSLLDDSVSQALLAARIVGKRSSYATDNPRESQAVFAYMRGGPRPLAATAMGKHLVALEDARRAGYAPPAPPTPTPLFPPPTSLPPFTPTRTIDVGGPTGLSAAITELQAGDLVNVSAFAAPGEIIWSGKNLVSPARFVFAPGFQFTGAPAGSRLPSVWVTNCSNIQFVGGDVTGSGNQGIRIDGCSNILWHGVTIHDTAGTGLIVQGTSTRACTGMDIEAEIWNCGLDLSLDPHQTKGTGNHGSYLGAVSYSAPALLPVSGRFVLDVHDQPYGAACQNGNLADVDLWLRAKMITFVTYGPYNQVGGNALQPWGNNVNVRVHYLEADNVARAVETDGNPVGSITVEYGRCTNNRLTPAWPTVPGLVYQDVV